MAERIHITVSDGNILANGDVIVTSDILQRHADTAPHQEHLTLVRTIINAIMRENDKPSTLIVKVFKHINAYQGIVHSMTGVEADPPANNLRILYYFIRTFDEDLLLCYDRPTLEPPILENQLALQALFNATEERITLAAFQHAGLPVDVAANAYLLDVQLSSGTQLPDGSRCCQGGLPYPPGPSKSFSCGSTACHCLRTDTIQMD